MTENEEIWDPDGPVEYKWPTKKVRAAMLKAEDGFTLSEIAGMVEVSRHTVAKWNTEAPFLARVEEFKGKIATEIEMIGIARQADRIAAKHKRWKKLEAIMELRAEEAAAIREAGEDPNYPDAEIKLETGAGTGVLGKRITKVGTGERQQVVIEFVADKGLLDAMSQLENDTMKELGQGGAEKLDLTSAGGALGALFGNVSMDELDQRIREAEAGKTSEALPG